MAGDGFLAVILVGLLTEWGVSILTGIWGILPIDKTELQTLNDLTAPIKWHHYQSRHHACRQQFYGLQLCNVVEYLNVHSIELDYLITISHAGHIKRRW